MRWQWRGEARHLNPSECFRASLAGGVGRGEEPQAKKRGVMQWSVERSTPFHEAIIMQRSASSKLSNSVNQGRLNAHLQRSLCGEHGQNS